jgi:acetylornithine aminotransferase
VLLVNSTDVHCTQVRSKGERLRSKLREALGDNPHVKEVRGLGLICGVQLDVVREQL